MTLSPTELACLMWAAQGRSTPEIAAIANIHDRMVRRHLDNAGAKLGAINIASAVAVARSRGLLIPQ